jgi:lipid-binding SYLF domain-containing protein
LNGPVILSVPHENGGDLSGSAIPGNSGLFAGISLEGSTLRPDDDASADVYGRKVTAKEIVLGGKVDIPVNGRHLVEILEKSAQHKESKEISSK